MRTQFLVFTAPHSCEVQEADLDEAIGSREVLVRNRLGLISPGTELAIFMQTHRGFEVEGHWARYPYWPGYCNVGEVVAAGARCPHLAPGDRVVHGGNHATFTPPARCLGDPAPRRARRRARRCSSRWWASRSRPSCSRRSASASTRW